MRTIINTEKEPVKTLWLGHADPKHHIHADIERYKGTLVSIGGETYRLEGIKGIDKYYYFEVEAKDCFKLIECAINKSGFIDSDSITFLREKLNKDEYSKIVSEWNDRLFIKLTNYARTNYIFHNRYAG